MLAELPAVETARLAAVLGLPAVPSAEDHTALFVLQLPPYASIYLGAEGQLGGEARDRVAGLLRAVGAEPPPEPDHLAVLLSWYATLAECERGAAEPARRAAWRTARAALLWEHLASWLPAYLAAVVAVAPDPLTAWARLLGDALEAEARDLPPHELPLHFRALELSAPPADVVDLVLAPAWSGMILTRHDLARGAESLGLGLRVGERRFALQGLLDQDRPATCAWLAAEAAAWAARHEGDAPRYGPVARWWRERARATARALTPAK